jgi:hypothetical protein
MEIQDVKKIHLQKFWDDEYQSLNYIHEQFNDADSLNKWAGQGYTGPFTGVMCDMRSPQPSWNYRFIDMFSGKGWKDIGTSYYRMDTGVVLPEHSDLYKKYIDIFKLQGKEETIWRAVVFLEDWKPGHIAEYNSQPFTNWRAGDTMVWKYDTPHMAANLGLEPRYTLQITGHT